MNKIKNLKENVESRQEYLLTVLQDKEHACKNAPTGILRASSHGNKYQYYIRNNSKDINGKYIPEKNRQLAVKLAQKEYDMKIIKAARKELFHIQRLSTYYKDQTVEDAISTFSEGKQVLIKPIILSDEQYIDNWLHQEYISNPFHPENLVFDNGRGIKMRSKSEVIISNILDGLAIPYIYEKELRFNLYSTYYPDFTILDVKNRKEVYLEHLGMMDNPDYIGHAHEKIMKYEKEGYYIGDKLFITYETSKNPLNIELVKAKLERFSIHSR